MVYECPSTSTKYNWYQVNELDRAMQSLRLGGILEDSLPYKQLYQLRGKILAQIGFKFPRVPTLLKLIGGLSPGIIKVWHDSESGWLSEARERPGALPVYHYISDEQAIAVLKEEITPELHDYLMTPDDYIGE